MKKSIDQKIFELGQAKFVVDQCGVEFWDAAHECEDYNPETFVEPHIVRAMEELKELRQTGEYPSDFDSDGFPVDSLKARIQHCPHCLKAFGFIEAKKAAKRVLSAKKGIVLKAAKQAYRDLLKVHG